ncbi:MAG: hypothetical protein ACTSRW_15175 [Candidatus Helarchaeota archaeon]
MPDLNDEEHIKELIESKLKRFQCEIIKSSLPEVRINETPSKNVEVELPERDLLK